LNELLNRLVVLATEHLALTIAQELVRVLDQFGSGLCRRWRA
jgi:hypothetical protein